GRDSPPEYRPVAGPQRQPGQEQSEEERSEPVPGAEPESGSERGSVDRRLDVSDEGQQRADGDSCAAPQCQYEAVPAHRYLFELLGYDTGPDGLPATSFWVSS